MPKWTHTETGEFLRYRVFDPTTNEPIAEAANKKHARLVASSPELLEALGNLLLVYTQEIGGAAKARLDGNVREARAAIAKATTR